jgi:hypothetical protein
MEILELFVIHTETFALGYATSAIPANDLSSMILCRDDPEGLRTDLLKPDQLV